MEGGKPPAALKELPVDISSGLSSVAAAPTQYRTGDVVSLKVAKKAQDIQAQSALQLLESVPEPTPAQNLPDNLGKNLNVVA